MTSGKLMPLDLPSGPIRPSELSRAQIPGLYVHIPFCFHKCHYCDFYSITRQGAERMARFVDLLLAEADMWTASTAPQVRPRSVFFGGGTPSLLPIEQMRRLIAGLRDRFEQTYPPPTYAIKANGLEVAKAIHYGSHALKDKWEGFQKGWQAASEIRQEGTPVLRCSKCDGTVIWKRTEEGFTIYHGPCGGNVESQASRERAAREIAALALGHENIMQAAEVLAILDSIK